MTRTSQQVRELPPESVDRLHPGVLDAVFASEGVQQEVRVVGRVLNHQHAERYLGSCLHSITTDLRIGAPPGSLAFPREAPWQWAQ